MPTRCVDAVQLTEQLARIADGPTGPQVGAFFDLDGTLVAGYTASTFFTDRLRHREVSLGTASRTIARALDGASGASVAVAQGAVTDLAPPEERPRLLGLLGAAFGVGFVIGPGGKPTVRYVLYGEEYSRSANVSSRFQ